MLDSRYIIMMPPVQATCEVLVAWFQKNTAKITNVSFKSICR